MFIVQFFITLFCCIGIVLALIFMNFDLRKKVWNFNKGSLVVTSLLIVVLIANSCIKSIPSNHVGVQWSPFGGTKEQTIGEGVSFVSPLDKIYLIPTTVQEKNISNISIQTKDAQFLTTVVNAKFQVNKENAFKIFKNYTTIDNLKENVIANYTQKAIESVVTEYNIIEVLGEKKNEIYSRSTKVLEDMLAKEGVVLTSLTIIDMDAGEAIEKAIQDEAVAKKAVETAKQLQEKAKTEAETKLIEAEGEAKANAVKTEQLTDKILAEMWINKWNGQLPTVSGSNDTIVDISELIKGN